MPPLQKQKNRVGETYMRCQETRPARLLDLAHDNGYISELVEMDMTTVFILAEDIRVTLLKIKYSKH